jgi:hypothetical protein
MCAGLRAQPGPWEPSLGKSAGFELPTSRTTTWCAEQQSRCWMTLLHPWGPCLSRGRAGLARLPLFAVAGLGGAVPCGFSPWLPVCAVAWAVSSWSARSRAAARTNELDAGKWRPIIGSGEEPPGLAAVGGSLAGPPGACGRRSGLTCTHSAPAGETGAMTVPSGDRAAQSGHRARLGRLMRKCELARGLRPLPVCGCTAGRGLRRGDPCVGEQVVGAG